MGMLWIYVKEQPNLPTPSYSVLVYVSVFIALSTVFHSVRFLDNCSLSRSPDVIARVDRAQNANLLTLLSHSVLPVLILPYWSF